MDMQTLVENYVHNIYTARAFLFKRFFVLTIDVVARHGGIIDVVSGKL